MLAKRIRARDRELEYRVASESDLKRLAELRWQFRTDEDEEKPRHTQNEFILECERFLREGLSSGTQAYWLAIENDEIVSHVFVHRIPMIPRPCKIRDFFGYITNAYTLPRMRGEGIGAALMKRVIEWAQSEDLELLIVWPSDQAIPFYQRLGFDSENDVMQLTLRPYYDEEADSDEPESG